MLFLLVPACIIHGINTLPLFPSSTVLAQGTASSVFPPHYVIASPQIPGIELLTHTVDMQLQFSADATDAASTQLRAEQVILSVSASYRFHNTAQDGRTLQLTVAPSSGQSTSTVSGTPRVNVQIDNQAVALEAGTEGTGTFQLALAADQRRVVVLTYTIPIGASALPTINYPVDWLERWDNNMSLRVNMRTNSAIPPESWTILAPDGWNYALSNDIQQPDIKWLYDIELPDNAFQLQFVHPSIWQTLQNNIAASVSNPGAAGFLSVGNTYKQIYLEAIALPGRADLSQSTVSSVADLFYAQAVAAYTEGIQEGEAANDPPSTIALLHAQLAGLYRYKIIASGSNAKQYAELTAREAVTALSQLPADSALRSELIQWQIEGLYSLLQNARQQQRWSESLAFIEQLMPLVEANPTPAVNRERLNEIRRIILIQEALDLLEGGNKEAAIQLAGPEIANAELQPSLEEQSLFRRWQIDVTVQTEGTVLSLEAFTDGHQLQRAQNGLSSLIGAWEQNDLIRVDDAIAVSLHKSSSDDTGGNAGNAGIVPEDSSQLYVLTAKFFVEHEQPRDAFLQTLPDDANWALLRELFKHLTPQVERVGTLFMEDRTIRMNLDLRAAGDHWDTMAARLSRDAEAARTELANAESSGGSASSSTGAASSTSLDAANAALTARIRAVNFANEAEVWQDLSQNSWIMVRMEANTVGNSAVAETLSTDVTNSGNMASRSWLATVETPPQSFQIEAASLAPGRIALLLVSVIIGLFFFSGLLWWLL